MKTETTKLLAKAHDCLEDARFGLTYGRYIVAVNRAYYAMFDACQALLHDQDIHTKTHQGVNNNFHKLFVKTGKIDKEIGKLLDQVFDMRQSGDYDLECELEQEDADFAVESASKFIAVIEEYFKNNS